MHDIGFYFFLAVLVAAIISSEVTAYKRRKALPPRTPRAKWLAFRMSIGALMLGLAVIGLAPFMLAIVYANATGAGPNNHRDTRIVIAAEIALWLFGILLYVSSKRELRELESRPAKR